MISLKELQRSTFHVGESVVKTTIALIVDIGNEEKVVERKPSEVVFALNLNEGDKTNTQGDFFNKTKMRALWKLGCSTIMLYGCFSSPVTYFSF